MSPEAKIRFETNFRLRKVNWSKIECPSVENKILKQKMYFRAESKRKKSKYFLKIPMVHRNVLRYVNVFSSGPPTTNQIFRSRVKILSLTKNIFRYFIL